MFTFLRNRLLPYFATAQKTQSNRQMPKAKTAKPKQTADDLRGLSKLAINATRGITDLVEAMHHNIARIPGITASKEDGRTNGISGMVYRTVHGVTQAVGTGIDSALALLAPYLGNLTDRPEREHIQSALNGVLGDHLLDSNNPLAIHMQVRRNGLPLQLTAEALAAAIPNATGKILVLVHGLCMNDLQWASAREDSSIHDHGIALQEELGFTALYLHYNTGLTISENGLEFSELLETLSMHWPVAIDELVIVAHSMGGLVSRSAHYQATQASMAWPKQLNKLVFLGTPHFGAPLERGGHWFDLILGATPYAAPFAKIGKTRSKGITSLRHGYLLKNQQTPIPLPDDVQCLAIAGLVGQTNDVLHSTHLGDGLVPLNSALGQHDDPARHLDFAAQHKVVLPSTNHMQLLHSAEVYLCIKQFLST
jgi:pimeloyl-ACP methyl ester carboxylesterase